MSEAFQQDVADRESAIQALREEGWSHQREGRFDRADLKWRALVQNSADSDAPERKVAMALATWFDQTSRQTLRPEIGNRGITPRVEDA